MSGGAPLAAGRERLGGLDESRIMSIDETTDERKKTAGMAELYAIMQTTEQLESAYVKDLVNGDEYKTQCGKLLSSYEAQKRTLLAMPQFTASFADVRAWVREYHINLPRAWERLEVAKRPAEDAKYDSMRPDAAIAAKTTAVIITLMDAVRTGMVETDQLMPYTQDAAEQLDRNPWLGADFAPKVKLHEWLRLLRSMKAADSLSSEQQRQFLHDVETLHADYTSKLGAPG